MHSLFYAISVIEMCKIKTLEKQVLDPMFVMAIDDLLNEKILPDYLVKQLLESLANHATAEYLMPKEYFENKFKETQNLKELADLMSYL